VTAVDQTLTGDKNILYKNGPSLAGGPFIFFRQTSLLKLNAVTLKMINRTSTHSIQIIL
jgi:hypothetical protein